MKTQIPLTVFYTDDDPEDLEIFRELAQSVNSDVEVVTLESGKNLLTALENPPPSPHVIFLDLNMPGFTGFDVLQRLRSREEYLNLPIVVFTTSNDQATIDRSRELGANYFLPKCGDFPALKKSIEHTLKIDWNHFNPDQHAFVYAS